MQKTNLKLKIKLFLKFIFNKVFQNFTLKNKILKFFGRDYELSKKELNNLLKLKIDKNTKTQDFIVSLTTFPSRIPTLKYTLHSIFMQTLRPKKVILSLSEKEFQNTELTKDILEFEKFGLCILWNKENLYQYNKIIPILKEYKNKVIITLDDDIYYPYNLLEGLFNSYLLNKNVIHCQRGRIIKIKNNTIDSFFKWKLIKKNNLKYQNNPSFGIFLEGVGGVLYPPNSLHKDVCNEEKFKSLCPKADDVWLWSMAVINKTKINVVQNNLMANGNAMCISPNKTSLWFDNLIMGNDRQIANILKTYKEIFNILIKG